jgi:asparagine synthase (glutamine-hydrolysing)
MCGIAGMIVPNDRPVTRRIRGMVRALEHRGPDGQGVFLAKGSAATAGLGHCRLAILDLSAAGVQPMTSRDGRWTIALNGEVFNYRDLRKTLEVECGTVFVSNTDTEVLLEACAAWGIEKAVARTIGMFAFAVWDGFQQELTLVRDRAGEKPVVYFWDGQTLAFASEMKALADFHGSKLDPRAADLYFALGYIPAPLGIFRHTFKLQAGHMARWTNGALRVSRWWFPESANADRSAELRDLLSDAVRLRLRSDVPVAIALSGGVDSSIIAAEAKRHGACPDAFTVALDGDETDLPYARLAASRYGLRHEIIRMRCAAVAAQLETAVRHYDEPFADSSSLASLALAEELRGRYKVILNGDGGDEAFGGYQHYERIASKQLLKSMAAAAGFRDGAGQTGIYVQSKAAFREHERARLLNGNCCDNALATMLSTDEFLNANVSGALKRAMWSDRHLHLANGLTYKMDIALGSAGMEGRAPFLDHRILEWTQNVPARDLVCGREKKVLLRRTYAADLPEQISNRPKHGFGAPVRAWLAGPLRPLVAQSLPCALLNPGAQSGLSGQRLWTVLTFARWAEAWNAKW